MLPPIKVFLDVSSCTKSQTQVGVSTISIKKNKVASAATRCLVANTKQQFTKPDIKPPNKKQRIKSWIDIGSDPVLRKKAAIIAIRPESTKHGSMSLVLFNLKIMVKKEKQMAVKSANMLPQSSPICKAP